MGEAAEGGAGLVMTIGEASGGGLLPKRKNLRPVLRGGGRPTRAAGWRPKALPEVVWFAAIRELDEDWDLRRGLDDGDRGLDDGDVHGLRGGLDWWLRRCLSWGLSGSRHCGIS